MRVIFFGVCRELNIYILNWIKIPYSSFQNCTYNKSASKKFLKIYKKIKKKEKYFSFLNF